MSHSAGCLSLFSEGGAVGQSMEERRTTVAELKAVFKATGFPFHVVPLEQVYASHSFYIILRPAKGLLTLCPDTESRKFKKNVLFYNCIN